MIEPVYLALRFGCIALLFAVFVFLLTVFIDLAYDLAADSRGEPEAAHDGDFSAYKSWSSKLVACQGDYIRAEMVKAFHLPRRISKEVRAAAPDQSACRGGTPPLVDSTTGLVWPVTRVILGRNPHHGRSSLSVLQPSHSGAPHERTAEKDFLRRGAPFGSTLLRKNPALRARRQRLQHLARRTCPRQSPRRASGV